MRYAKRILCIIMSLAVLLSFASCSDEGASSADSSSAGSTDSAGADPIPEDAYIWEGDVAEQVITGDGTEESPYIIYLPSELAYAVTSGGGGCYYKLANDIYLNDVTSAYWALEDSNNHWNASTFKGVIDGDGYCIYGLWMRNADRPDDGGLVSELKSGGFKNLGIRYSYVSAKNYAGAFAGRVSGQSFFENCFADETVFVQYTDMGRNGAGGIIGYAAAGGTTAPTLEFSNCYSKAEVLGLGMVERVNGMIGTSWNCAYTMKNCYSSGLAPYCGKNSNTASYLLAFGWKTEDVYQNIYTDNRAQNGLESFTLLSADGMISEMSFGADSGFETVEGDTPKLKVFTGIDGKTVTDIAETEYLRYVVMDFAGGTGTEADPYIVVSADQLLYVVSGYWENTYFKMIQDIYVNTTSNPGWTGTAATWTQSSSNCFGGNFDGNGFAVHGLYFNDKASDSRSDYGLGLFPRVGSSAVIKNVHIKDSILSGSSNVGGIAGGVPATETSGRAQIIGCSVDSSVTLKGHTVGGVLGYSNGYADVTDCVSKADITAAVSGDIVGYTE